MNLSIRVPTPVSIVHAASEPPLLVKGKVVSQKGDLIDIDMPSGTPTLSPGASLILDFPPDAGVARAIIHVVAHGSASAGGGSRLVGRVVKIPIADQREYPRMHGGIRLRYTVVPGNNTDAADAWLRDGTASAVAREPDPFMNFSATGLAFEDIEACAEGDIMLCAVGVPGNTHNWRATASVVRVMRIPIDERDEGVDATHRVAVHFIDIPDEAREALRQHTIRIQEAYL